MNNIQRFPIDLLTPYDDKWTIVGRLTYKSPIRTFERDDKITRIMNCQFADETGEIRAILYNEAIDRYNHLVEGNVYTLSNARIKCIQKRYCSIPKEYEIIVSEETDIFPYRGNTEDIKVRWDYLMNIDEIIQCKKDTIIDFVGVIINIDDIVNVGKHNIEKRTLYVVDPTNKQIELILWGRDARKEFSINQLYLFKNLRVNWYQEQPSVVWSYSSYEIILDQNLIVHLDNGERLVEWFHNPGDIKENVSRNTPSNSKQDWITIKEAKQRKLGEIEDEYFWTTAYVTMIKYQDCRYYYTACANKEDCLKGVEQKSDGYYCKSCNKLSKDFVPRYLLSIVIADHTSTLWLRCFGQDGETLIGKPCSEVAKLDTEDTQEEFAQTFKQAYYNNFHVRVKCSPPYRDSTYIQYSVAKLVPINIMKDARRMIKQLSQ